MRRRLLAIASVLSLLLSVIVVALWASQFEWHWTLTDEPTESSEFFVNHGWVGFFRDSNLGTTDRSVPFWLLAAAFSICPIFWYLLAAQKQRLGWRLFTVAAAASLLACVAAVLLWTNSGGLWVTWNGPLPVNINRSRYHYTDADWGSARFLIFRFVEHLGFVPERWVVIPGWLLVLVSAPLPILWELSRIRGWRQGSSPEACPNCSYDLTGNTSGICPECGTPIARKPEERA